RDADPPPSPPPFCGVPTHVAQARTGPHRRAHVHGDVSLSAILRTVVQAALPPARDSRHRHRGAAELGRAVHFALPALRPGARAVRPARVAAARAPRGSRAARLPARGGWMSAVAVPSSRARYGDAYAKLREKEGRGAGGDEELFALPYLTTGPLASQW